MKPENSTDALERPRPFVLINVAMSVDGKLAPAGRKFVPFTSPRDRDLLFRLRAESDAVMSGARTVDSSGVEIDLGPGPERWRRHRLKKGRSAPHLRVVVSGSASVDPNAKAFRSRVSPLVVLTCGAAPKERIAALRRAAVEVRAFGGAELDFGKALEWLYRERGVRRLLCEGGGELNAALFRGGLVDEVRVTVSPRVFGGREAPTLADGIGVARVGDATELDLIQLRRAGEELFLVYRVRRGAAARAESQLG